MSAFWVLNNINCDRTVMDMDPADTLLALLS